MATSFPLNAQTGDEYNGYIYDGTSWNAIGNEFNPTSFSASEPVNPKPGDLWVDSDADVPLFDLENYATITYVDSEVAAIDLSPYLEASDMPNTPVYKMNTGTTEQRPSPASAGMFRYNSTTGYPEWYDSITNQWINFKDRRVESFNVEYLVVAGGGGGGRTYSGGGGAGGYRSNVTGEMSGGGASAEPALVIQTDTSYPLIVGAGGAGMVGDGISSNGFTGSNSRFADIISSGGGGGGAFNSASRDGGSGGGAAGDSGTLPGSGTLNQGYAGGGPTSNGTYRGGGGGGAGAAGVNGLTSGAGGIGVQSSITGISTYRAGGGGGGGFNAYYSGTNAGGTGGGGLGGNGNGAQTAGTANTGGGGGAAGGVGNGPIGGGDGKSGGSGIVIIKIPNTKTATFSNGVTYDLATTTGFKIYTITATSTTSETVTFN